MRSTCWICGGDARRLGIYGDWDALVCQGCGRYKISRTLLQENTGKAFNVQWMRADFGCWRVAGLEPIVNRHNAYFGRKLPHIHTDNSLIGWPAGSQTFGH